MAAQKRFFRSVDGVTESAVFASALGWMGCCWRAGRLTRTTFGHRTESAAAEALAADGPWEPLPRASAELRALVDRLERFARDFDDDFRDVPIDVESLTAFQRKVLAACRAIPPGETRTYGQLAAAGGSPKASRAAGSVMARNRFPLVVPCHRIVGSSGSLGGFSAPQGIAMKRRLLDAEQQAAS